MNIFKRFRRPSPPRATKALPYARLTLTEWCASTERVVYVQQLLADPMFRELLGMLANVRPLAARSLDATAAAVLLGQRIGHDQIIASLLAAGVHPPSPPAEIAADYNPEKAMAAWETESTE